LGVPVIWVLHANSRIGGKSDWELFFNTFVADDVRQRTLENLTTGKQSVWNALVTEPADHIVLKNRYSALIPGASPLERVLRGMGVDTILVAGAKTNVCCESTARDAMMLDFKVVLVEDCCAALSDDEHRGALENIIQQFGDVMTAGEVLIRLRRLENRQA
jgi:ureidoacrylate peracid hydrolase